MVILYDRFTLDDPCNIVLRAVHWRGPSDFEQSDHCAIFPTVDGLIEMVKSDNDLRQQEIDRRGGPGHPLFNVPMYVVTIPLGMHHTTDASASRSSPMVLAGHLSPQLPETL